MDKIDFVITWVDGNDPAWQSERSKYTQNNSGDKRTVRYRDWDNLMYWFRGIEKFAPWVSKIHFITWGHVPEWLDTNNPKINIVKHEDFIPSEYLPTFNSHTIEFNMHRIKGLSEKFVYFNDDMFIIRDMKEKDFFRNNLPCDTATICPLIASFRNSIIGITLNNMEIINTTFKKNEVIAHNFFKWFNPVYKRGNFYTLVLLPWRKFAGFKNHHLPIPYLKSTFNEVWEKEGEVINKTCLFKFRNKENINHWLMRYWQFATGKFTPRSVDTGFCFSLTNNNDTVFEAIRKQKYKMICVNDNDSDPIVDFDKEKELLKQAFRYILSDKSSFEL